MGLMEAFRLLKASNFCVVDVASSRKLQVSHSLRRRKTNLEAVANQVSVRLGHIHVISSNGFVLIRLTKRPGKWQIPAVKVVVDSWTLENRTGRADVPRIPLAVGTSVIYHSNFRGNTQPTSGNLK